MRTTTRRAVAPAAAPASARPAGGRWRKGDVPAAVNLLDRARRRSCREETRLALPARLGIALRRLGRARPRRTVLSRRSSGRRAGEPGLELAATIERAALLVLSDPGRDGSAARGDGGGHPGARGPGRRPFARPCLDADRARRGLWRGQFAAARRRSSVRSTTPGAPATAGRRRRSWASSGSRPVRPDARARRRSTAARRCSRETGRPSRRAGALRAISPCWRPGAGVRRGARRWPTRSRELYDELGMRLLRRPATRDGLRRHRAPGRGLRRRRAGASTGLDALEEMGDRATGRPSPPFSRGRCTARIGSTRPRSWPRRAGAVAPTTTLVADAGTRDARQGARAPGRRTRRPSSWRATQWRVSQDGRARLRAGGAARPRRGARARRPRRTRRASSPRRRSRSSSGRGTSSRPAEARGARAESASRRYSGLGRPSRSSIVRSADGASGGT